MNTLLVKSVKNRRKSRPNGENIGILMSHDLKKCDFDFLTIMVATLTVDIGECKTFSVEIHLSK